MSIDASLPPSLASAPASASSSNASTSSSSSTSSTAGTLASNFQTFLTLLTTQLQNQNPLDPLDTNQFTQQLVQFAQVEQQLKANDQLASLVSLQKTAQSTQALSFVGATAVVDGSTAQLTNGQAAWSISVTKPVTATVNITNSAGVTVFTGQYTVNAGSQTFGWNGKGNDGSQWQDGSYSISVTAKDSNGQTTAVSTEVQGIVDSADLTQDPPLLSIGGQNFTLDKIKRVVRTAS
jgi:flagellar basal-body rod modification protein FlgD